MNDCRLRCDAHSSPCLRWGVRILAILLLLMGMASMLGCAGIHFYNKENDSTTAAAKKASDEISFKDTISEERTNLAKLLTRELDIVAQFSVTRRNTALRALLEDKIEKGGSQATELLSKRLKRFINDRLIKLAGKKDLIVVLNNVDDVRNSRENLITEMNKFSILLLVSAPNCEVGLGAKEFAVTDEMIDKYTTAAKKAGVDGPDGVDIDRLLNSFKDKCVEHQQSWKALNESAGLLKEIVQLEEQERKALNNQEKEIDKPNKEYKIALEDFKAALKIAETDASEATKKKIKEGAEALQKKLSSLAKAGGAFGQLDAAEAMIKEIDLIIEAVGQGKVDEETKQALAVVAQFPSFAAQIAAIEALSKLPPVNALLFEKERLLALKEDAERRISRTVARIALLQKKRDAVIAEIEGLVAANQNLEWALKANANKPIDKADLNKKPIEESARRQLVMALVSYLNTFTGPRRLGHEIDYCLIDLDHAQVLDASETALKLWEVAIKQPVNVLAAYHSSGIKKEDIVELIKAAGLFTIAAEVK